MQLNVKDLKLITRFDYRNLIRSAPGVIFLVLYLAVAVRLGGGFISASGEGETGLKEVLALATWVGHAEAATFLSLDRPPVMSFFFLLSLMLLPFFVLLLAFNQVSGYVKRGSIRYIVLKTGRLELYLGLFFSNVAFFTVVSGATAVVITLGWALVGGGDSGVGTAISYSLRIFVALWFSSLPLIAFMSMNAAMLGSPLGTVFLGAGIYLGVDIVGWIASRQSEYGVYLHYLLPLEVKYWFAYQEAWRFALACIMMLGYTALYLWVGWVFLKRRNL